MPNLRIQLAATEITGLTREEDGHMYHGSTTFLGADFHVYFFLMKEGDIVEPHETASDLVWDYWEDLSGFNDGAMQTVMIPGVEGRYVMVIFPFAV